MSFLHRLATSIRARYAGRMVVATPCARFQVTLGILGVLLAGCGSQAEAERAGAAGAGSGGQSSTLTPEVVAFRDQFVAAYCHVMVDCPSGSLLAPRDDLATCEAEALAKIESDRSWSLPNLKVDAALAQTCVGILAGADCPNGIEIKGALLGPCAETLRGEADVGDSCARDQACRAGLRCDRSASCPGECVAIPAEGEPCPNDDCRVGLVCFQSTCTAPTPVGSPCGASLPDCGEWQVCSDPGTGRTVCRAVDEGLESVGEGEVCTMAPQCADGLYCSGGGRGTCIPQIPDGEPCDGPILKCRDGRYCAGASAGVEGTCSAKVALGGACTYYSPGTCAEGRCQEGVCALPVALGGACNEDLTCLSGFCSAGRCALAPLCP